VIRRVLIIPVVALALAGISASCTDTSDLEDRIGALEQQQTPLSEQVQALDQAAQLAAMLSALHMLDAGGRLHDIDTSGFVDAALLAVAATTWPADLQGRADEVEAKLRDLAEALDGLDVAVVGPAVRAAHGVAHELDHDAFTFIAEAIGMSEDGHEAEATPTPGDGMGDMDQTPAGG
jgi:hypothetical protein